jgi:hypothetical protein
VLSTGVIKVNNNFTLKDIALLDKLVYNLLFVSNLLMLISTSSYITLFNQSNTTYFTKNGVQEI